MSIINDMLRDLDSQRAHQAAANDGVLLGLAIPGATSPPIQKTLATVAVLCALVLLAVFIYPHGAAWLERQHRSGLYAGIEAAKAEPPATADAQALTQAPVIISEEEYLAGIGMTIGTEDDNTQTTSSGQRYKQQDMQADHTAAVITHQFSLQERIERNFQQASQALRDGDDKRAETMLGEILSLDSGQHESRLLLAKLQLGQQRNLDAETTLAAGLAQYPGNAAYARLYAQLLVEQTRFDEAVRHLQAALPAAGRDADFHALLAGLYQRTGRAMAAARHYQVALKITPEKGEWWMGLGISLEQSGSRVNAYAAYRRALRYLDSYTLQEYVKARISNLSRMRGTR